VGALLGNAQSRQTGLGHADVFNEAVGPLVWPVSVRLGNAVDAAADFTNGMLHANALTAQNRDLKARMGNEELYDERVGELQREVDGLRKMIGLSPPSGRKRIPAEVAAIFPSDSSITITAGSAESVRAGMAVVTGDGLVGIVQSVGARTSQVTLVSSPYLRIGAVTSRNPPSAGLLHGESTNMLVIEFLDFDAAVQNGDLVITSGFSEHIPRGIPIGRIVAYEESKELGIRRSRVFPFVHIGAVREVFVLE
jgi:rod shape-determining protein MreC